MLVVNLASWSSLTIYQQQFMLILHCEDSSQYISSGSQSVPCKIGSVNVSWHYVIIHVTLIIMIIMQPRTMKITIMIIIIIMIIIKPGTITITMIIIIIMIMIKPRTTPGQRKDDKANPPHYHLSHSQPIVNLWKLLSLFIIIFIIHVIRSYIISLILNPLLVSENFYHWLLLFLSFILSNPALSLLIWTRRQFLKELWLTSFLLGWDFKFILCRGVF